MYIGYIFFTLRRVSFFIKKKKIKETLTGYDVESLFYIMLETPKEKLQTR